MEGNFSKLNFPQPEFTCFFFFFNPVFLYLCSSALEFPENRNQADFEAINIRKFT